MDEGQSIDTPSSSGPRRIEGSIDLSVGDLSCGADLWVGGNVLDGREVRASGSVHVRGVIQASLVVAGGLLRADGGISGRDKGCCRAGGSLLTRYVTNASAESIGDMTVLTEVLNSRVICGGEFVCEQGAVVASHVSAAGGIHCRSAGNPAGVRTVLEAGVDAALEREALAAVEEIEANSARSAQIRHVIDPLMRNQKSLTPQQRERATELLFEADELERQGARRVEEVRRRFAAHAGRGRPELRVAQALHPGTLVRLGDLEATIDTPFVGPLHVLARSLGHDRWIAVLGEGGGEVDLQARAVQGSAPELLRRLVRAAA